MPSIVWTPSTGIRNGEVTSRTGVGNGAIHRRDELVDRGDPARITLERTQRRAAHDRDVHVAVLREQLGDVEHDQVDQLGIGDVQLVDEHDEVLHADLTSEQDVLARLVPGSLACRRRAGSRRPSATAPVIMFLT